MTVNLNFKKPYTPPAGDDVKLNFTLNDGELASTSVVVNLSRTSNLHIEAEAHKAKPVSATLTITVSTVQTLNVQAAYDNRVFRGPSARVDQAWQEAAPVSPDKTAVFQQSENLHSQAAETWQPGQPAGASGVGDSYVQAAKARSSMADRWQLGIRTPQSLLSLFQYPARLRAASGMRWETANRQQRRLMQSDWQYPPHIKVGSSLPWGTARPVQHGFTESAQQGTKHRYTPVIPWQTAKQPSFGQEGPPVDPPVDPPFEGSKDLDFICPWLDYAPLDILLKFGLHPCPEDPVEPGDTVIVPVKRVYIVLNTTSLRRVDGNVLLPTFSLSLSIDADSWTWGFNASLPDTTLDAIEPGSDGTPVELEAIINGTAYRVLAEQISRDRTFGRSAIRVSGKGKSAILGAPYAPVKNFSNSSAARTAQQLMNDALTVNGASIGWSVNWAATDWLVPAGAWSHQGSYITALNAIAGAAGAYIQPHPNQKTLSVLSRYPTAPWNWGSLVPDFELPADVTTRESIEWLERPRYNRVFVSGQGQGVLGQVTRGGTAGDIVAPMVTDALITHADAARQRGLAVLGDTGRQAHLSLRLPVLEETGVIQPGKFVRYVDGGVTRLGIVRSTSVDVSNPEVWQTIGVETHVATA